MTQFVCFMALLAQGPTPTAALVWCCLPAHRDDGGPGGLHAPKRPQQKKREKREREEMYASMKKNDRVLTVGGVIGTLISVKDTEVVLKVDESSNTKMTFLRTSVQRILSDGDSTAGGR